MKGLFLLYSIEILGALLCGAENITESLTADQYESENSNKTSTSSFTYPPSASSSIREASSLTSTQSPTAVARVTNSPQSNILDEMFNTKECLPVLMVTGGLIIACTILLVSTLLLIWKVCQLSRRIKALSGDADLISSSEYWVGTAKKSKSKSETEPNETSVLMPDHSQTREEMGHGTTEEEGGKVNKDGQTGEENKKEVGDSQEASTTPVAVAENSSSPKPQEEATNSQPAAASTSEGSEEPKEEV